MRRKPPDAATTGWCCAVFAFSAEEKGRLPIQVMDESNSDRKKSQDREVEQLKILTVLTVFTYWEYDATSSKETIW